MSVRKGEPWGRPYTLTGDEPVAETDAALVERVRAGDPAPIRLTGGDLYRSLGGRPSPAPHALPVDLIEVTANRGEGEEATLWAAAHVVARGAFWGGDTVVVMNATHLGKWNLGPRAHPDDGLLDVTEGRLAPSQRWKAARRAASGTHVPHPALRVSRVAEFSTTFPRPRRLVVDGVRRGSISRLAVRVMPDAAVVVL